MCIDILYASLPDFGWVIMPISDLLVFYFWLEKFPLRLLELRIIGKVSKSIIRPYTKPLLDEMQPYVPFKLYLKGVDHLSYLMKKREMPWSLFRFRDEGEEKFVEELLLSGIETSEERKIYTMCNVQRVSKRMLYSRDAYLLAMYKGTSIQILSFWFFLLMIYYISCWHQLVIHRPFNLQRAKVNLGSFISLSILTYLFIYLYFIFCDGNNFCCEQLKEYKKTVQSAETILEGHS